MSDASILIMIDWSKLKPSTLETQAAPINELVPVQLMVGQWPSNRDIKIFLSQPNDSSTGGWIVLTAPKDLEVSIDFQVEDRNGKRYWTCGAVFKGHRDPLGAENFARHQCDSGTLTLYSANTLDAAYEFILLIQNPETGEIALVDPKFVTGGT
jgi:hypothetical protein